MSNNLSFRTPTKPSATSAAAAAAGGGADDALQKVTSSSSATFGPANSSASSSSSSGNFRRKHRSLSIIEPGEAKPSSSSSSSSSTVPQSSKRRKSLSKQQHQQALLLLQQQQQKSRMVDAVTMTVDSEFPGHKKDDSSSGSPLLTKEKPRGSNFISMLVKHHNNVLAKNNAAFDAIVARTENEGGEEGDAPLTPSSSIIVEEEQKSAGEKEGEQQQEEEVGVELTEEEKQEKEEVEKKKKEEEEKLKKKLEQEQKEREAHQHHNARTMMRPSEFSDTSIFPQIKQAEDEYKSPSQILRERQDQKKKKKKKRSRSQSPSRTGGHQEEEVDAAEDEDEEDEEDLLDDDAVIKAAEREAKLQKAVSLPDEVLTLVRKLRSSADIIGSSEGAPPPDALREVAVHSASLARFVSSWTLKELAEKEAREASMHRAWLTDAAKELKERAENFGWATSSNSPATTAKANASSSVNNNNNRNSSSLKTASATAAANSSSNNNNNNNNFNSAKDVWPKSYAAITSNLGPWILSTLYLIMDSLLHAVQCDRGAIFVPDDAGKVVSAVLVGAGGIARPIRVRRGHGVVGEVFRSGVAVNVLSTESVQKRHDEIFTRSVDNQTGFFTRNILSVPVFDVGNDLVENAQQKREKREKEAAAQQQLLLLQQQQQQHGSKRHHKQQQQQNKPETVAQSKEAVVSSNSNSNQAIVGRAKVVAVVQLLNKLVPANGEFTPADELLVAQTGSVIASMLAACGGVLQLGTEAALKHSAEMQARLLMMRPAVVKARKQFLTATAGGCDSEESGTGKFSFTQILNLHEEQKARERSIALQLSEQTSATDLSRCGASNEKIQDMYRIGGASTKVLRIGGDGGSNTEAERTLQDMASFVGRIEAAWANTRERCVIAEAEANASRNAFNKLEHEFFDLRRLARRCGIIKDPLHPTTSGGDNNNLFEENQDSSGSSSWPNNGTGGIFDREQQQQNESSSAFVSSPSSAAFGANNNNNRRRSTRAGSISFQGIPSAENQHPQHLHSQLSQDSLTAGGGMGNTSRSRRPSYMSVHSLPAGGGGGPNSTSGDNLDGDNDDRASVASSIFCGNQQNQHPQSRRGTITGGGVFSSSSSAPDIAEENRLALERLLHAGDPNDHWDSAKGAFLDFFQSKTQGYRTESALEVVQERNRQVMRDIASTSTVGKTLKSVQARDFADKLLRAGPVSALSKSAAATRHRHRVHHNTTIKERAEVDPLSTSCKKLQELVGRHENELNSMLRKHEEETRELYAHLLNEEQDEVGEGSNKEEGFGLIINEFLTQQNPNKQKKVW